VFLNGLPISVIELNRRINDNLIPTYYA